MDEGIRIGVERESQIILLFTGYQDTGVYNETGKGVKEWRKHKE